MIRVAYISDWLAPVPGNPLKALCRYCNLTLSASYSHLGKHLASSKHTCNAVKYRYECSLNPETQSVTKNPPPTMDGLCHVLFLESVLFQFTGAFLFLLLIHSYVYAIECANCRGHANKILQFLTGCTGYHRLSSVLTIKTESWWVMKTCCFIADSKIAQMLCNNFDKPSQNFTRGNFVCSIFR